ncbi:hypothetical protein MPER_01238, partial [Moniliophthora perniciosa FA553]
MGRAAISADIWASMIKAVPPGKFSEERQQQPMTMSLDSVGTFTLVEGSDYVSYTINDPQLGVVEGETFTATETVSRFLVQGGTTAAGVTPTAGGSAGAPTTSPTGAQTSGGSASSPTNTNAASAVKLASSGVIVGAGVPSVTAY